MSKHITEDELTAKLLQPAPKLRTAPVDKLSAPNAEQGMAVTLDELRPYDRNPRTQRNPKYEEIKESIRQVGLKHPPSITQRPGDDKYMISDGGNTRLQILNELWKETGDERFFRFWCVFRPWVSETRALAGHLAENEIRGDLSWIDKSLKVAEAKTLYEAAVGKKINNSELARRLKEDGLTLDRSHISRMLYTVEHFLPSIPNTLNSGLGKDQIKKLIAYREACQLIWERCEQEIAPGRQFDECFHETLAWFDDEGQTELAWNIIDDRLCGMLVDETGVHMNVIAVTLTNILDYRKRRWDLEEHGAFEALTAELAHMRDPDAPPPQLYPPLPEKGDDSNRESRSSPVSCTPKVPAGGGEPCEPLPGDQDGNDAQSARVETTSTDASGGGGEEVQRLRDQVAALETENARVAAAERAAGHIEPSGMGAEAESFERDDAENADLSESVDGPVPMPASTLTDEQQQARRDAQTLSYWEESPGKRGYRHHLAKELGVPTLDFEQAAVYSVPLMAGSIEPRITDIWFIEGSHDSVRALRIQVREFAQVIARWGGFGGSDTVVPVDDGLGIELVPLEDPQSRRAVLAWQALASLGGELYPDYPTDATLWGELLGTHDGDPDCVWDDEILVRYFRLIRLIRRLRQHLNDNTGAES